MSPDVRCRRVKVCTPPSRTDGGFLDCLRVEGGRGAARGIAVGRTRVLASDITTSQKLPTHSTSKGCHIRTRSMRTSATAVVEMASDTGAREVAGQDNTKGKYALICLAVFAPGLWRQDDAAHCRVGSWRLSKTTITPLEKPAGSYLRGWALFHRARSLGSGRRYSSSRC